MRILYESDLAGSKYHGMAYRIYQFSYEFKKLGHEVMIVAASYSHVRHTNPKVKRILSNEIIDGIIYKWIKTPSYKGNGFGRVFHMLIYNFRLWLYAKKIAKEFKPDVVIASGVTPLDFIGCNRIAKESHAKIILEVGDLWPLTPIELGGYSPYHPFIVFMSQIEKFAYKNTDAVISLLPYAHEYMCKQGLAKAKFNYIPNGVIEEDWITLKDIPLEYSKVIELLKKQGKFIIGFTGTHSISNALEMLLKVAFHLKDTNIVFILVGDGPNKHYLVDLAEKMKINNVLFMPPIKKEFIPSLLKQMDVLYVGFQKQSLYRFGISPNKIFDYMMAAKPIIQAIEAKNDIVNDANCGVSVNPDDQNAIANAIIKLKLLSQEGREKLGKNGKKYVIENHTYNILTRKFFSVINNTLNRK